MTMKRWLTHLFLPVALLTQAHFGDLEAQAAPNRNANKQGPPPVSTNSVEQGEARIPVDASHTPGDAQYLFIIGQPGSYYLRTNVLGVSDKFGINIASDNVTLDLNGFSLLGTSGAVNGISIPSGRKNIIVRNGFISNWGPHRAVPQCAGVSTFGSNVVLEHLMISDNRPYGVYCSSAVIRDCTITGSSYGIFGGSVVSDCRVENNGTGIFAFSFSLIKEQEIGSVFSSMGRTAALTGIR